MSDTHTRLRGIDQPNRVTMTAYSACPDAPSTAGPPASLTSGTSGPAPKRLMIACDGVKLSSESPVESPQPGNKWGPRRGTERPEHQQPRAFLHSSPAGPTGTRSRDPLLPTAVVAPRMTGAGGSGGWA